MSEPLPKVVIVDDDTSMRRAVERLLQEADFAPHPFASAEALLGTPAVASAACFVLDVRLPGLDGFALYQRLREGGSQAPVIFITAHDDPRTREQAVQAAAIAYLPKPFPGTALLEAVYRALDRKGGAPPK